MQQRCSQLNWSLTATECVDLFFSLTILVFVLLAKTRLVLEMFNIYVHNINVYIL
ncbi:hypothetical protein CDL12_15768 [Handroanthus impetiginosus]|uniref:Uncharacterized protein n=1 Tax=Handroanthus impetiginosus TaxID=429701 RepID=A0A2G9H282_9LAMI|nr:hypothetical protein CDL12_15768 [Handroanthus impetiginosus]